MVSKEKGTTTGIYSEEIEKRESRTNWVLYKEDIRRMQEHVEQQDEGSHASQHQFKTCPMDSKMENTDAKKETKKRMEGIIALNQLMDEVCLSLMFKDKEIKRFDEDRLRRMHNHYMQEYFESISKEGEGLEQDTINIKGNLYTTKVQSFTDFVAFLNLVKLDDVVSQEWDYFRKRFNMVVKWFFNHYLNRSLPGNIPPIINEFDMVGEIKWLNPKGNGEEIRRCYMNFLEILTSHYKTARAPRQGNMDTMLGPARRDRECHHQGEIGRDGAQWRRPAVLKEKGNIEHFGVQLEDTNEGPEEPIQGHYKGNQNLYAESSSRVKEEYGPSTDNSSDDFTVIT
ncbi:hypothetical protein Tco_0896566 [Tanacetum coccineum]